VLVLGARALVEKMGKEEEEEAPASHKEIERR